MITLKVEDYCQNCPDFTPDAATIGIIHGHFSDKMIYETVVYCKKHKTCERIYECIKKEMSK